MKIGKIRRTGGKRREKEKKKKREKEKAKTNKRGK